MTEFEGVDKYTACADCSNVDAERIGAAVPSYRCKLGLKRPRCVSVRRGKISPDGARLHTNLYECPSWKPSTQDQKGRCDS